MYKSRVADIQIDKNNSIIQSTNHILSDDYDLICNICFDIFDETNTIVLKCGSVVPHKICKKCNDIILKNNSKCPFCLNKLIIQPDINNILKYNNYIPENNYYIPENNYFYTICLRILECIFILTFLLSIVGIIYFIIQTPKK